MLDGRDETFLVLVTRQSMKKACTSITVLEEITLELLSKKCFLSRLKVEKIQLQLINHVQERDVIFGIMQEVLMIFQISLSSSNPL
jgi:hypothetical protein